MNERLRAQAYDPRALIREAYRIEAITPAQCRSIFLDWVLGAAPNPPLNVQITALLACFGDGNPAHPMSEVLRAALEEGARPAGRRGGWRARRISH